MSLQEEIENHLLKHYNAPIDKNASYLINKILGAAVEAGWREVHKMPDKDQRHRSIIDPIFEAINKLRSEL